ncbi:MAG: phage tail length tape measure family protein, partial [Deltaproteobacteria bacterium]|nr:phage tail length tape measure family protein [Deltaproteobacteria bacterium]
MPSDISMAIVLTGKNMAKQAFDGATRDIKKLDTASVALKKSFMAVSAAAAAVAGVGLYKLNQAMREGIQLAGVQEKAEAKLEAVIRATGGAAGYTAQEMKEMAASLQQVTTYGDETIINAQAMMATFKEIGRETFPDAIKAALDMSTVMDQDLKSSVVQIGKALNDPIKGMTALSRVGVTFTEEQKNMVRQLVESNRVLEAQQIILEELNSEFGGAATGQIRTYAGAVQQAENAYGDLLEELGFVVTKNEAMITYQREMSKLWQEVAGYVRENREAFQKLVQYGVVIAIDAFVFLVDTIQIVKAAFEAVYPTIAKVAKLVRDAVGGWILLFKELINSTPEEAIEQTKEASGALDFLRERLEELRNAVDSANLGFKDYINVTPKLQQATKKTGAAVKALGAYWDDYLTGWEENIRVYNEVLDAEKKIINELKFEWEGYLEFRMRQIEAEKESMLALGVDQELASRLASKRMKDLWAEYYDYMDQQLGGYKDNWETTNSEIVDSSKQAADGVKAAWKESMDSMLSDWDRFYKEAVSDTLYHAMKGDFDSIEDAWDSMLDSMLRSFADWIGELIAEWVKQNVFKKLFSGGGGGFDFSDLFSGLL